MKLLATLLLAVSVGLAFAQTGTSPNLVYSTVNPYQGPAGTEPYTWSGFTITESTGGGLSGGSVPGYNTSTGTFMFGYNQGAVAYVYAFNQALRDSGLSITGYNYSWQHINQDYTSGTLSANVNFAALNGTSLHSKSWTLGPTINGWTTTSGTETFINGLPASNISNFSLSFTGKDSRWWAGYYGPQVRNPSMTLNYTFDQCATNPLSSPSCPGYQEALLTQQCTANPLYSSSCPGYASALLTQQCTVNPLYSPSCPNYATAYFQQQCSIDPLYNSSCPGYSNAYLQQQCSVNPLYSTSCSGYQQAYHDQQCSLSPLSYTDCPGYASAYLQQQCSVNPLYSTSCSGYQQAYFNQQCQANGLYSTQCPNYGTAYATQQALLQSQQTTTTTTSTTSTTSTAVSTTQPTVAVSSSGTVSTSVPIVSDTNVNTVITSTSTSTAPTTPSAPVQLTAPTAPTQTTSPTAAVATTQTQQKTEEKKSNDSTSTSTTTTASTGNTSSDSKSNDGPKTARQELQERRESVAKAKAVEAGKNLANEMGKSASMEQQVAVQNVVIQAMGYSPAFEAYKVRMPDAPGYKPYAIYAGQRTVDNRRVGYGLFGATDKVHADMVQEQYELRR